MKLIGICGNIGSGKDTAANFLVKKGWVVAALADRIKQLAHKIFLFDEETLFGPSDKRNAIDPRGDDPSYWFGVYFRAGQYAEELSALFGGAPGPLPRNPIDVFREMLSTLKASPSTFSARRVLQLMGTEWGRALWDGVWVQALRRTIRKIDQGVVYSRLKGLRNEQGEPPPGVVVTDCRFPNEGSELKSWGGQVYWIDSSKRSPRDTSLAIHKHASEPTRADFEGIVDGDIDNNGTLGELQDAMDYLAAA